MYQSWKEQNPRYAGNQQKSQGWQNRNRQRCNGEGQALGGQRSAGQSRGAESCSFTSSWREMRLWSHQAEQGLVKGWIPRKKQKWAGQQWRRAFPTSALGGHHEKQKSLACTTFSMQSDFKMITSSTETKLLWRDSSTIQEEEKHTFNKKLKSKVKQTIHSKGRSANKTKELAPPTAWDIRTHWKGLSFIYLKLLAIKLEIYVLWKSSPLWKKIKTFKTTT